MTKRLVVTAKIEPDGATLRLIGRDGWALVQLVAAGQRGCTPIDNPAPRWSGYTYNLRKLGLDIETLHENHKGAFPGHHGRYVLRTKVTILPVAEAA